MTAVKRATQKRHHQQWQPFTPDAACFLLKHESTERPNEREGALNDVTKSLGDVRRNRPVYNKQLHNNKRNVIVSKMSYIDEPISQTRAIAIRNYLHEVLGASTSDLKPWARANELPYFLRDAFQFAELKLVGQTVVLAMDRAEHHQPLREIRAWLDKVRVLTGQPSIYVTDALASYERRRLIELKVPFIVPGNQLYLPDLGLDLREYFRQRAPVFASSMALSPSAQAMLITALLQTPWQTDWQPSKVAVALGYTPMTLSRAVKELTATELVTAYTVGRSRWLHMELPPKQIWERAKQFMRTPVRRTVWVAADDPAVKRPCRVAGLSALASHSMLAEPRWPVYALSSADWKAATGDGIRELPEPIGDAHEWQVWSYSPALLPNAATVDPLSLTLSLQDSADERVQLALDELSGVLPW